jgi:hypothetical protein
MNPLLSTILKLGTFSVFGGTTILEVSSGSTPSSDSIDLMRQILVKGLGGISGNMVAGLLQTKMFGQGAEPGKIFQTTSALDVMGEALSRALSRIAAERQDPGGEKLTEILKTLRVNWRAQVNKFAPKLGTLSGPELLVQVESGLNERQLEELVRALAKGGEEGELFPYLSDEAIEKVAEELFKELPAEFFNVLTDEQSGKPYRKVMLESLGKLLGYSEQVLSEVREGRAETAARLDEIRAVLKQLLEAIDKSARVVQGQNLKFADQSDAQQPIITLARLPVTGPDLFGRDHELKLLDEAWPDPHTNVVTFIAWGGVGKTALVNTWLARMAKENFRGAERVYAWSFYSQGTSDERAASADLFIDAALRWFGDDDPIRGSPWDKGERLANLVRRSRTLLVLDGLEPLQYPPGPQEGKLKDQAMQALLRELAAQQRGLCVITTRAKISDLEGYACSTVRQEDLDTLTPQAGAQILRAQGVQGAGEELEQASAEFGGHSLALTLLGSYLADVCGGDIRRRGEIGSLEEDERHGGHARRVMAAYERWLGEGPELAVLRLLGLFDRPAPADAIAVLRAAPVIPGLTDSLQNLGEEKWQQTLAKLRRIELLAESSQGSQQTSGGEGELDAHPLVREHFGQQLRERLPGAWREANNRLYEYLRRAAKELPETVEEMAKLYAAVAHGCAAGRYQEVWDEVYWGRILRRGEFYSTYKLGTFGAELAALSWFVDPSSKKIAPGLTKQAAALAMRERGYSLRALGQLHGADEWLQAARDAHVLGEEWVEAAIDVGLLSQLHLIAGDLPKAIAYAEQGALLADQSGDDFRRVINKTVLGDAQHHVGDLSSSESNFREAEAIQKICKPEFPYLYTGNGIRYCNLLLSLGRYQEVIDRIARFSMAPAEHTSVFSDALEHLYLAGAYLLEARQAGRSDFAEAAQHLEEAVDGTRRAGQLDPLSRSLLARAVLFRLTDNYSRARSDLAETQRLTERSQMGLHLCDCHLEWARLHLAQGDRDKAREHWATAKAMVARMGYHRRDKDVEEIEKQL